MSLSFVILFQNIEVEKKNKNIFLISHIHVEHNDNFQFNYQYSTWMQRNLQQTRQSFLQKMYQNQQPDFHRKKKTENSRFLNLD